jgi:gluconolactonase
VTQMSVLMPMLLWLTAAAPAAAPAADAPAVIESAYAPNDFDLTADPNTPEWTHAPRVVADHNYLNEPIPGPPTEIRSRWTKQYLYLLYICPYDQLNLKPDPTPAVETPRLWNWDVGEAFIGSDFEHIARYKELQVSPQSEWVDLDIDRDDQKGQQGMAWNSGYTVKGRIDAQAKIWYGEMRIPFSAIDARPPQEGRELRIGLYRIAGANPRTFYAWRPTGQTSFHVPQAFGTLRLAPAPKPKPEREFALEATSPQFWKLVDKQANVSIVASGFGFTEGPVWDPAGFLYVSDEVQNFIYVIDKTGARHTTIALGNPDGNTYDKEHHLIDCASDLRAVIQVDPKGSGSYKVLVDRYDGKRLNTPNDIVLGPDGALYFTDPTLDLPKGEQQELPFQGVYRLGRDGKLDLLIKDLEQPNGLAFPPDGKRLYVDDSKTHQIHVYDFKDGRASNGHVFGTEPGKGGTADGMRLDMAGNLFVTGPGGIWIWNPQGQHLGTIVLPQQPANLTWGGPDYQTLFITAGPVVYELKTLTHGFVPYR